MLKNFRLQITIRMMALAVTLAACVFLWLETAFYFGAALISLLVVYEVFRLIHYTETISRRIKRFLDAIRHADFSQSFTGSAVQGRAFEELDESFGHVVEAFKKQRLETQAQFRYMQTVVRHIGVGLISFDGNGDVELLNTAAKRLFDVGGLQNINELEDLSPDLLEMIKNIADGEREVVRLSPNNQPLQLAVHATVFRLRDELVKLVSLQDINAELEEKEVEAWQNLTQVLAHEIMNSVTPIASLSETVKMLLEANIYKNGDGYIIDEEAVADVSEALDTIENRSEGLIRFVNSYRDITKIPEPEVERFSVQKLLHRVKNLNSSEAKQRHITFQISVEPDSLKLTADPHLVEQVLINLIKNAFRALKGQSAGTITLRGRMASRGGLRIEVMDDGAGISSENIGKVFIPFYSTQRPHKKGGSGIGLSLSQQIMRAHGGTLRVQSTQGKGSTFILQF